MKAKGRIIEVLKLGWVWMIVWGAFGATVSIVVEIVSPQMIGAGEGPLDLLWIVGRDGGVSGIVFGLLLALGERNNLAEISVPRAMMWGVLAGLTLPLVRMKPMLATNTCVLGALTALACAMVARMNRGPSDLPMEQTS